MVSTMQARSVCYCHRKTKIIVVLKNQQEHVGLVIYLEHILNVVFLRAPLFSRKTSYLNLPSHTFGQISLLYISGDILING